MREIFEVVNRQYVIIFQLVIPPNHVGLKFRQTVICGIIALKYLEMVAVFWVG